MRRDSPESDVVIKEDAGKKKDWSFWVKGWSFWGGLFWFLWRKHAQIEMVMEKKDFSLSLVLKVCLFWNR